MHNLPPPDGSLRNRRGYGQLPTQEPTVPEAQPTNQPPTEGTTASHIVQEESWRTLVWSFSVSSLMTVSLRSLSSLVPPLNNKADNRLLRSRSLRHPGFRTVPCRRLALVLHAQPLVCWTRYAVLLATLHCLIYKSGIIMGFPTALAMNLVRFHI